MKKILRLFGLVTINDVVKMLDEEAKEFRKMRKELETSEEIWKENSENRLANYSQCCLDLKINVYLLHKFW
jgi:hypothetical protein